jgi:hypothetical protein
MRPQLMPFDQESLGSESNVTVWLAKKLVGLREHANQIPGVVLDNAARYYAESTKEYWDNKSIPYWVPPWPLFFMEYNNPKHWNLGGQWEQQSEDTQFGILVLTIDTQQKTFTSSRILDLFANWSGGQPDSTALDMIDSYLPKSRWAVFTDHWVTYFGKPVCGRPVWAGVSTCIFIGGHGQYLHMFISGPSAHTLHTDKNKGIIYDPIRVLGLGMSFCHCKNTEIISESSKNRRQQKRSHIPQVTFKTLHINSIGHKNTAEQNTDGCGSKKSLHICRGHFSTYSDQKPLFGKYVGTFWIPCHVRGSESNGITIKNYALGEMVVKQKAEQEKLAR